MFGIFNKTKTKTTDPEILRKQLQTFERISYLLVSGTPLEETLTEVAKVIPQVLGVSLVAILLWNKNKKQLTLEKTSIPRVAEVFVESSTGGKVKEIVYPTGDSENLFTKAIEEKQIQYTQKVESTLTPLMTEGQAKILVGLVRTQIKLLVVVPLLIGDEVLGVIALGWKSKELDDDDRGVISTFAYQVAVGMYNSRLFTSNTKQLELLASQNERLQSINSLTNKIITNFNPSDMVQEALDVIPELFGYLGAIYASYDKETKDLHIRAYSRNELSKSAFEMLGMDPLSVVLNLGDEKSDGNVSKEAINEDKIVFTNRFHNLSRGVVGDFLADRLQDFMKLTAIVTLPVKMKGEIVGALNFLLANQSIEQIKEKEIETIRIIANQISVALENASLYQQVQEGLEQVKIANQQLQEKYQFEKDMMGIMGHELRTPMTVARGMSELLIHKVDNDVAHEKEYFKDKLEKIHMSVMKESELIQTMLSTSHIDNNKMNFQFMDFDLQDIIDYSVMAFKPDAVAKGLELIYEKPAEKLPTVYSDQNRIQEVINNLISNAIKYTNTGSVKVYLEFDKEFIHFHVKDTGIGIPENEMQNIGKKFYRIHQQDKTNLNKASGTGLGLYVVKGLLEALGGKLEVESEAGKGSTFTAVIPVKSIDQSQPNGQTPQDHEHKGDLFKQMGLK